MARKYLSQSAGLWRSLVRSFHLHRSFQSGTLRWVFDDHYGEYP